MNYSYHSTFSLQYVAKALVSTNSNIETDEHLSQWCNGNFSREDSFVEVRRQLSEFVMSFSDNLSFILEIPFLKYLLAVAFVNENQYIGITFIMSLLAFKKFCIDSNLPVDDEAEEKSVLTEPISVLEDTQEVSGTTKEQA